MAKQADLTVHDTRNPDDDFHRWGSKLQQVGADELARTEPALTEKLKQKAGLHGEPRTLENGTGIVDCGE